MRPIGVKEEEILKKKNVDRAKASSTVGVQVNPLIVDAISVYKALIAEHSIADRHYDGRARLNWPHRFVPLL